MSFITNTLHKRPIATIKPTKDWSSVDYWLYIFDDITGQVNIPNIMNTFDLKQQYDWSYKTKMKIRIKRSKIINNKELQKVIGYNGGRLIKKHNTSDLVSENRLRKIIREELLKYMEK